MQTIPKNEIPRLLQLAELNLDYVSLKEEFNGLAELAARITGTPISHINLIDAFHQWTIGDFGFPSTLTPREETVCQFTILNNAHLEVKDLKSDQRFKEKGFVTQSPYFRYYYGIPIQIKGSNVGSICVIDTENNSISSDKIKLLEIIAKEVTERIKLKNTIYQLTEKNFKLSKNFKILAHDVRGPIGGISGLADIILQEEENLDMTEYFSNMKLMKESSDSVLNLVNDLISEFTDEGKLNNDITIKEFAEQLFSLFHAQAQTKQVTIKVNINPNICTRKIPKNKYLQMIGNLVSNSIKFSPKHSEIQIDFEIGNIENQTIMIRIKDSGIGMTTEQINEVFSDKINSTLGTSGEVGNGFGIHFVKLLVDELKGTFSVISEIGKGCEWMINLPMVSQ
ncbi:sensor histidine kinase [Leptospira levettii]|uniref:GAF domain-containing sensor histidine kinase n=1 Tax=Leptospira levettii TaxID=2023178 RepID=UPI001082BD5D|nr:GAF domain-containing sensor histidine kinase [Leptospira levettii]TGM29941.1 sensor histidine kinase [Leptospira levettii]TGM91978.1 sensor histidine kinase [Leptospira levettii]